MLNELPYIPSDNIEKNNKYDDQNNNDSYNSSNNRNQ